MVFRFRSLLFLTGFLLASLSSTHAQKLLWQKAIGDAGYDNGMAMLAVDHNCFVLGGTSSSNAGIAEGNHSVGGFDILITRVSAQGQVIWSTMIGGSGTEDFSQMKPTSDGGVIVMGTTNSKDGDITDNHGKMDFFLAKLGRSGNLEWTKCYGGVGNDKGYAVTQTMDGGYLIGGESGSKTGTMTFHKGGLDAWVAKLDGGGNVEVQKSFGARGNEKTTHLMQLQKDRYLALCTTNSQGGDVKDPLGAKDVWLLCLSKNFDVIWQRSYGGSDFDEPHAFERHPDGDLIIGGTTFSDDKDLDMTTNHGLGDSWILKLSTDGRIRWSQAYGGAKSDGCNGLTVTPDGGFLLVGTSNSKDVGTNKGLYDGWFVRADSMGRKVWQGLLGGKDFEYVYAVHPLEGGNYLGLGFAESTDGDLAPLNKDIGNDFWFFRFTDPDDPIDNQLSNMPYLMGKVFSSGTGLPVNAEVILTDNRTLKNTDEADTERGTGFYEMDLPTEGEYSVMYSAPGYMFYGQDLDLSLLKAGPEIHIDAGLEPIMVGSKVILKLIYFDVGKYDLRKESDPELARLKRFLKTNPNVKVEISGHTDNTGSAESKEKLSRLRASRVRDWLLKAGVPGKQMQVAGYGMKKPLGDNATPEGRAKNRRVEVEIVEIF